MAGARAGCGSSLLNGRSMKSGRVCLFMGKKTMMGGGDSFASFASSSNHYAYYIMYYMEKLNCPEYAKTR